MPGILNTFSCLHVFDPDYIDFGVILKSVILVYGLTILSMSCLRSPAGLEYIVGVLALAINYFIFSTDS